MSPLMHTCQHSWRALCSGTQWDIVIAHFLGVDHCGHRYGPNHPEMTRKVCAANTRSCSNYKYSHASPKNPWVNCVQLDQLDRTLAEVMAALPERTLLAVLGDHGMTAEGDHGGDTAAETAAALFLYAHRCVHAVGSIAVAEPLADIVARLTSRIPAHSPPLVEADAPPAPEVVQQIDLVPTLALLLGHPIPFGSLGAAIPNVFGRALDDALWWTVRQVRYGVAAQGLAGLPSVASLDDLAAHVLATPLPVDESSSSAFREAAAAYLRGVLAACRASWAQFHVPYMATGVALAAAALGVVLFRIDDAHNATVRAKARCTRERDIELTRPADPFGSETVRQVRWRQVIALALLAAWAGHFASNSLVVAESDSTVVLAALAVLGHALLGRAPRHWGELVGALFCLRASAHFVLCREEQAKWCEVSEHAARTLFGRSSG